MAELVKVFDTEHESEALVVKGLLDSAGIDADLTATDAAQETFPGVGGMIILVREEDAERALRIIEDRSNFLPRTTLKFSKDTRHVMWIALNRT
jgi:hypothetical protein